jgi:hypothetical protein
MSKSLPHSLEAEQSVLGALFLAESIPNDLALPIADFYNEANAEIYKAMCDLDADVGRFDVITLAERLKANGTLEKAGGYGYLSELSDSAGTTQGVKHHTSIISEKADRRRTIEEIRRLGEIANDPNATTTELRERIEQLAGNLTDPRASGTAYMSARSLLDQSFAKTADVLGHGVAPEGSGVIIAGPGGLGKSMLRTDLAVHLALGMDVWGLPVPKARRILLIQFENTWRTEQTRLRQVLHGLGNGNSWIPTGLNFSDPTLRFDLTRIKDRERLEGMVRESGCDVVIYDPLASLSSADENKNDQMRNVLDSLTVINRRCGTTCFLIHHFRKPTENGDVNSAWMMRGAAAVRDWCDTQITATRRPNEHKILIQLDFHKIRNGPDHKPILLERNEWFLHRPTEPDVLCPPSAVCQILNDIGGQIEGAKDFRMTIRDRIGCGDRSAWDFIQGAVKAGVINESKNGRNKVYEVAEGS